MLATLFVRLALNLWYRRVGSWNLRGGTAAEHRRKIKLKAKLESERLPLKRPLQLRL